MANLIVTTQMIKELEEYKIKLSQNQLRPSELERMVYLLNHLNPNEEQMALRNTCEQD